MILQVRFVVVVGGGTSDGTQKSKSCMLPSDCSTRGGSILNNWLSEASGQTVDCDGSSCPAGQGCCEY